MYPEEETTTISGEEAKTPHGKTAGVVLIGWLVAVGIATVIHFVVADWSARHSWGSSVRPYCYWQDRLGLWWVGISVPG